MCGYGRPAGPSSRRRPRYRLKYSSFRIDVPADFVHYPFSKTPRTFGPTWEARVVDSSIPAPKLTRFSPGRGANYETEGFRDRWSTSSERSGGRKPDSYGSRTTDNRPKIASRGNYFRGLAPVSRERSMADRTSARDDEWHVARLGQA